MIDHGTPVISVDLADDECVIGLDDIASAPTARPY